MGPELGPSRVYHFRQDITLDNITLDRFYCIAFMFENKGNIFEFMAQIVL